MSSLDCVIHEVLHQGERTCLLRGRLLPNNSPVILKVLNEADQVTLCDLRRLEHEYTISSNLDLPSIVKPISMSKYEGRPVLVMEDFGGTSLEHFLKNPLTVSDFLTLAIKITESLKSIHEKNVLHLDIKPQNILLKRSTNEIRIIDFGIATSFVSPYRIPNNPYTPQGTWPYIAPEQTGRMNRAIDFRSDLYSLGVTFFQMLTGELPFSAKDPLEWVHCHIARRPPSPTEINPTVPGVLSNIVLKLLAKTPEDRYQSAAGILADLLHCETEFASRGHVITFTLAQQDISDTLQLSQKLHGREDEVAKMVACFESCVEHDTPVACLLGGYSGVGKSALVRELYKPVVQRHGYFITGKSEQYKRNIPYFPIVQAVTELLQQILSESEEKLLVWRSQILEAVGTNGKVVSDLIPNLEFLIGKQLPVAALGPAESQNRFNFVFQELIGVFATREHPLTLFLDDMQWSDGATLSLINNVLHATGMGSILVVLAYRDNEVDAAHPFTMTMHQLEKSGGNLTQIILQPLDEQTVSEFLSDSFRTTPEAGRSLTELIMTKTAGNPFFMIEFLRSLYQDGLIKYDSLTRIWRWDPASIRSQTVTSNVVDLLTKKLLRLPAEGQGITATAACLGNTFNVEFLATAVGLSLEQTLNQLDMPVEAGLIFLAVDDERDAGKRIYKFHHDKVQQAAYGLLDEEERKVQHLNLGRRLLAHLAPGWHDSRLFDIVGQFNLALDLLWDLAERHEVLLLNFNAGKQAKAASAYHPAVKYFAAAVSLMPPKAWETDYQLSYELHYDFYESEFLSAHLHEAEQLSKVLLARAKDPIDCARVYQSQIRLFQVAGDFERAVDIFSQALASTGHEVPADDQVSEALERERETVQRLLGARPALDLIKAPLATDPKVKAALWLLEAAGPPIYMVRPPVFSWIAMKMVSLSLAHGNTESSCYGYGIYGIILCGAQGDVDGGLEFSQLAIQLNERFSDAKLKGCMLHFLGDHVNFWKNHVASGLPILEKGFAACVEGGDLIYSNYIGFQSPWHVWESGASLEDVHQYTLKYASFAQRTKYKAVYETIRIEQQFILNLKGMTESPVSFSTEEFDEEAAMKAISAAQFGCGIAYYHILKTIAAYHAEDYAAAMQSAAAAEEVLGAAFSMPIFTSFCFYHALTLCAVHEQHQDKSSILQKILTYRSQLAQWAAVCPDNFRAKHALVAAEAMRIESPMQNPSSLYDEAIRASEDSGFIQFRALSHELAARYHFSQKATTVAGFLVREARNLYEEWGAHGKVHQLNEEFTISLRKSGMARSATSTGESNELDLLSILKSSQIIASQLALPELLKTLISTVLEYACAEKGLLFFVDNGFPSLQAEAGIGYSFYYATESQESLELVAPMAIVNVVKRTREKVIIHNASLSSPFSGDPYILRRQTKSILCIPLCRQGRLAGIIYLENNLTPGAFTVDRLHVLDLLAGQIAISIDNARLYQESQESVRSRDEFLSIVSHELKTPLTVLKLQLQMAEMDIADNPAVSPDELKESFEVSLKQVASLEHLVDDLLDVSRIQLGKISIEPVIVNLRELMEDVVERFAIQLASVHCVVTIKADEPVSGLWDRGRLAQLMNNLISNAIKYAPGKPIEIAISKPAGHLAQISVTDHGPGIDPARKDRIFDRFERATSKNISGLGLGLFISKLIVEAHSGSIAVDTKKTVGTSFIVKLPLRTRLKPER
ncbi:MAG TPA: ATP-binding sensor histidine kinase [Oligoflexus sp.]|uniref:ATP-binding sensor histidine kinase n=1 Tax=Oligoflexus sp. TaxID=1971216 RepID=UPI002D270E62|nr:ATP-binding sensor histidine kinase [Oligoflexus sp.]HYX36119.1 ATP-binding sensor histidine kinase [Oligoflexus sp.]